MARKPAAIDPAYFEPGVVTWTRGSPQLPALDDADLFASLQRLIPAAQRRVLKHVRAELAEAVEEAAAARLWEAVRGDLGGLLQPDSLETVMAQAAKAQAEIDEIEAAVRRARPTGLAWLPAACRALRRTVSPGPRSVSAARKDGSQ